MPGSLGNTSLVRMDIRYARTVRGLQNILTKGVKELLNIYLRYTRTEKVLNELPNIRVIMTSINTAEDVERVETEKVRMETVDKIVETLGNLGIDMSEYTEVRDSIIQEWFGSNIVEKIKAEDKRISAEPKPMPLPGGDDLDNDKPDFHSTPSNIDFGGDDEDIGGGPADDLIGGEDDVDLDVDTPSGDEDASNEKPQDIPYSLK